MKQLKPAFLGSGSTEEVMKNSPKQEESDLVSLP